MSDKTFEEELVVPVVVLGIPLLMLISLMVGCDAMYGVGAFGPTNVVTATVVTKHVDAKGNNYMVTTDKGTFESENGMFLGVWNSDELYGSLQPGKTYRITTEGNKVVGMFFQEYPYITAVEEVK